MTILRSQADRRQLDGDRAGVGARAAAQIAKQARQEQSFQNRANIFEYFYTTDLKKLLILMEECEGSLASMFR